MGVDLSKRGRTMQVAKIRELTSEELKGFNLKEGQLIAVVLDGVKGTGHFIQLPEHGDTIIHTHNGKSDKVRFDESYKI